MSEEKFIRNYQVWLKPAVFALVVLLHVVLFLVLNFNGEKKFDETEYRETKIFKLVDVQEFVPPPPSPSATVVEKQPEASERIEEREEQIQEKQPEAEEYLPQHKISKTPTFPAKSILSRLEYPKMAKNQGIEGVVVLELFIDKKGKIQKINVIKDPGYGFAESAVRAFTGVKCAPALINGEPCAVRFRYPVRFKLT